LFALAYASLAFHEAGHAAACRYGGGRPGAIGIGIYIVWPVFYTDVTDSYRFGRPGRLRTDLGGVYFNCVFALGIAAAYIATGFEPLLLAVVAQHLFVLDQFFPWVRLDGYYVVADLLGVSDLFSRIKPVLRSLLPGRRADPRVEQLKPWARAAVSAWVLTTIAAIAGGASLLFASAPRYLQSAWESLGLQADAFRHGVGMLDPVTALSAGIDVVLLALPVAGFLVTYLLLCHGMGSGLALARARAAVHGRTDWTGQGDRPAQAQ
jgi:putative peptide zinc metalloprotease protein